MRLVPFLLVVLAIALAPLHDATSAPAPAVTPEVAFEQDMMLRFHMHENFGVVRGIERFLLRGQLDDAKQLAAAIGQAPNAPGLGAFAEHTARVRKAAFDLASAKNLEQAVRREATLLQACAGCHVAAAIIPDLAPPPALPPDRDSIDARMARHLWAADRLWDGIVAGDDAAWKVGIDLLASGPPTWAPPTKPQRDFAKRLQLIADSERRTRSTRLSTRADTYGELFLTCVGCHTIKR